jgi:rare lipoprotein A
MSPTPSIVPLRLRASSILVPLLPAVLLAACSVTPTEPDHAPPVPVAAHDTPALPESAPEKAVPQPVPRPHRKAPSAWSRRDGPGDRPPANPAAIPDAVPRAEALSPSANQPYVLFGRQYVPMTELTGYRQRGVASWYGSKFHGRRTATGERYDMYGMTAAHPTLPIPSYARVTNVRTGQSVIVRVNDRGPFVHGRAIDLTWTAAWKLGYLDSGVADVEVESLMVGRPVAKTASVKGMVQSSVDDSGRSTDDWTVGDPSDPGPWVLVAEFANRWSAERLADHVAGDLPDWADAIEVLRKGERWQVRIGPWKSEDDAAAAARRVRREIDLPAARRAAAD